MIVSELVCRYSEIDEDNALERAVKYINEFIIKPHNIKKEDILEYQTKTYFQRPDLYACEITITWWEDADGRSEN